MVLGAIGDDSWLAKAGPEVVEDAEAELAGAAAASTPEDVAERRLRCVPTLVPPRAGAGGERVGRSSGPERDPPPLRGVPGGGGPGGLTGRRRTGWRGAWRTRAGAWRTCGGR